MKGALYTLISFPSAITEVSIGKLNAGFNLRRII